MAKKKNESKLNISEINLNDLAEDAGLTVLRDSDYAMVYDRLPSFIAPIDRVFGGGLPFGRMVEFAGIPSSGKSTLAFHYARVGSNLGCITVLIDVEGTGDRERLAHLGIDVSKVLVKQPTEKQPDGLSIEEVGKTIESTLELFNKKYPNVPVIYIWDSVGITLSQVEQEKDYGEANVGGKAKAVTQLVSKVAPKISQSKALFIGINQVRDDIGGNPMFKTYNVTGGKSWEHYASIRVEVKKKVAIKKSIKGVNEHIGHNLGIKVQKSKVSRPMQEADAFLISDNGLDYEYNLAKIGEKEGVLDTSGRSYEYVDKNGEIHKKEKDAFIEWLKTPEGQEVREEIMNKLIQLEFPEGHPALKNKTLDISSWIDKIYTPEPSQG